MSDEIFDAMSGFDNDDDMLGLFGEDSESDDSELLNSEDSDFSFGDDAADENDEGFDFGEDSDFSFGDADSEDGGFSFGGEDNIEENGGSEEEIDDDSGAGFSLNLDDEEQESEDNGDDAELDSFLDAISDNGDDEENFVDNDGAVTAEDLGFNEFTSEDDETEVGEVDSSALMGDNEEKDYKQAEFNIDNMYVDKQSINQSGIYIDTDAFELKHIDVRNIAVTANRIRKAMSIDKLKLSIKNEGLLNPIVVAPTKTEGIYVVVKGLRRLLACASVGLTEIPCIVNNKVTATEIPIVEALYSHSKPYTVQEMIDYIEYLKTEKGIASATYIEHLLNMESGDYNKLMDLIEDDDEEIMTQLLGGQMTIQQAFKKLEQKRKKMSKEEKDNARAQKVYSNVEEYGADKVAGSGETSEDGEGVQMDEQELSELISSIGDSDVIDAEDGEELRKSGDSIKGFQPHKQDPNDRERLDPKLRKAVLARDENTCKICEQISGQEYTEVLDVHHIHEVYLGGNDDIGNLITACTCCHKLIHLWGRGELHVRPFDEMDDAEARKFKRIIKLGNVIRKGMAAKGMSKKELKEKDQADTIGRRLKGSSDQVAG